MELVATIRTNGPFFKGKGPEIINRELKAAMHEGVAFLEKEVEERTPTGVYGAQGGLLASIHGEVVQKGQAVIMGIVGTANPYGEVIEKGRTAGKAWPPPGALLRWIEVKLQVGEEQAKRIEFLVRRKIGQKGFPGVHMFERAFNEGFPMLQTIFDRRGFTIAKAMNA
jgi:hypothetical protein